MTDRPNFFFYRGKIRDRRSLDSMGKFLSAAGHRFSGLSIVSTCHVRVTRFSSVYYAHRCFWQNLSFRFWLTFGTWFYRLMIKKIFKILLGFCYLLILSELCRVENSNFYEIHQINKNLKWGLLIKNSWWNFCNIPRF